MQRVIFLFVGMLSVVRATPFGPGSVDQPTPFRYTFRVEKVEFGNDALSEDSGHNDDYGIQTFEPEVDSNLIDESDEGKYIKGIVDLFGDLQQCNIITGEDPPKEGCVYAANGDVYFVRVLSEVDIKDVYTAFKEAGIEECKVTEDGFENVPFGVGCFLIDDATGSVHWIGLYDDVFFYDKYMVDDIKDLFHDLEKCDLLDPNMPEEGCVLFDKDGIHLINFLHEENSDDVERALSKLDLIECVYDEDLGLMNKEPCYLISEGFNTIHFLNLYSRTQDDNNDDDHYSEETYEIPDTEVSPPSLVHSDTESRILHQLMLKGIFKQQPVGAKKAKAVLPQLRQ